MCINKIQYDWIVIGGGIAGISVAEILVREGKNVLLLEKNDKLASETSKIFHEWMHSGTLYTLAPDNLLTLRYLLGATDDLMEYYSSYTNMNLSPTEEGLSISSKGWFNNHNIEYRYRVHKYNPFWLMMVSRSIEIINMVSNHDWLRRKAGAEYGKSQLSLRNWIKNIPDQLNYDGKFIPIISPDITMNSRQLITDLINYATSQGLEVLVNSEVVEIDNNDRYVTVSTLNGKYTAENVVMCSPDLISKNYKLQINTSYAPIAIVENLEEDQRSFVELDYNIKNCINLLTKGNGIGQAGGITLANKNEVSSYLRFVIDEHRKRMPNINVIDTYVGLKKELVQQGQSRNYLYHINKASNNIWSVVLGKFSLAFSMAPEFYRRVYHKNPSKIIHESGKSNFNELVSETSWQEIINNKR